jgi:curved DNA-binding protein CbpA
MDLQAALIYFGLEKIEDVTLPELKAIYRRLAKEKHPDQGGSNTEFVSLRKAFVVLKNEREKISPKAGEAVIVTSELAELNKDELLSKYHKDTVNLQNQLQVYEKSIADQQTILTNLQDQVKDLVNGFNNEKANLQNSVKTDIEKLEKQLNGETFWRRIFFFMPRMSSQEFWNQYNQKIQYYSELNNQLDTNFFKQMLGTYGEGLNGLKEKIGKGKV